MSTAITKNIQEKSQIVLTLCKVARIILYVAMAIVIGLFIATFCFGEGQAILGWHMADGTPITAAEFAKSFDVAEIGDLRVELMQIMIYHILALVMLKGVTKLFQLIKNSENPFTAQIVKVMKTVAIVLGIVVGFDSLVVGLVVGFAVYAFAMIFEYGQTLQQQADETL